jgi:hypothetical protein
MMNKEGFTCIHRMDRMDRMMQMGNVSPAEERRR